MTIAPARRTVVVACAALLATLLGALLGLAPAARADGGGQPVSVKVPWTGKITGTGPDGNPLGHNPRLHRGDAVHFDITGLSPDEQVAVTLHSSNRDLGLVHVADDGTTSYDLTVPNDLELGAHTITFTGVVSEATPKVGFTVVSSSSGGGNAGDNGGSGGSGDGSNSGSSGGGHGLASTGGDVLGLLAVAGGLIGVGLVLIVVSLGQRRRPA